MIKLRFLLASLLAALMLILTGCDNKDAAKEQKKIKAGFIYISAVGDTGWTYEHDQGREMMETLPFVEKSTYLESVPVGADAERSIQNLVSKGHNLIFANSYDYMDAMLNVAKKHPDVVFMHCSGYKIADNMGTYFGKIDEARFLSGIVAGKMTKSNILGYVAAYPIPEVIRGINAFALGARSVNPDAVVKVVWTNTWYDPAQERSAAESLVNVGADVLTMHQNTPAVVQTAEEKGVMSIGYNSDMLKYAPENFLTSPVWNWGPYYQHVATEVYNGTWKNTQDLWGIKEGMVELAPFGPKVGSDVKALVESRKQAIISGALNPFDGPLVDQTGKVRVEEGRTATHNEQMNMNYFVQGVQGSIN